MAWFNRSVSIPYGVIIWVRCTHSYHHMSMIEFIFAQLFSVRWYNSCWICYEQTCSGWLLKLQLCTSHVYTSSHLVGNAWRTQLKHARLITEGGCWTLFQSTKRHERLDFRRNKWVHIFLCLSLLKPAQKAAAALEQKKSFRVSNSSGSYRV